MKKQKQIIWGLLLLPKLTESLPSFVFVFPLGNSYQVPTQLELCGTHFGKR